MPADPVQSSPPEVFPGPPVRAPASLALFAAALLLSAVFTLVFFHFRRPPPQTPATHDSPPPGAALLVPVEDVIGYSVEGRPIVCVAFGTGPHTLLIKASIHGTEGAGTPLLEHLREWIAAPPSLIRADPSGPASKPLLPDTGASVPPPHNDPRILRDLRIILLPVANPDGLAAGSRFNARGVDLNRNFPAGNREDKPRFGEGPLTEPESRALHDFILRTRPDAIVTLHQPLRCVDYDGPAPAAALASRLARTTGLPLKKLGARPGSLGAWFGETLGRPIITLELPRLPPQDPGRLWSRYGPALTDLLLHPQSWAPAARPGPPPPG